MNRYVHRGQLKSALGIAATTTGFDAQLDDAAENVSRLIDDTVGAPVFPYQETLYLTPDDSRCLWLDQPLRVVTSLRSDADGDSSYETTWSTGDYWLLHSKSDAAGAGRDRPYWLIETRPNASNSFPVARRSVAIDGIWGFTNSTKSTTATVAAAVNATQKTVSVNDDRETIHPGMTMQLGTEQVFVRERDRNTSTLQVDRNVNGTTAMTYSSGQAIAVYEYPIFGQAALNQAGMDYRGAQMPMGLAGGEPFGTQTMRQTGGLHPFVARSLERFRKPVAL